MKKHLLLCLAALAVTCLAQQPASAWCNVRFKAGVDLSWQAGGNDFLWGLWRCGDGGGGMGGNCAYPAPYGYGMPASPYMVGGMGAPMGVPMNPMPVDPNAGKTAPPAGTPPAGPPPGVSQTSYPWSYYSSGYQPVGYYYPSYGYPTAAYAPGGYSSGYSTNVPSYWYGR